MDQNFTRMLKTPQSNKSDKNQGFAYDYGTNNDESNEPNEETEEESQLLKDILFHFRFTTNTILNPLSLTDKYTGRHSAVRWWADRQWQEDSGWNGKKV